jgi:long-subunit acyl-CoA synthetase (AMP-forming)
MALGGKMRAIIAGGAPLSPDVHEFLRICLRVNLAQVNTLA